jgi:hypothetical protein
MDPGLGKRFIVEKLEEYALPFIDTGMGVLRTGDVLRGIVTATTSIPGHREQVRANKRITFTDGGDDYDHNIQIADLNMLNAALAPCMTASGPRNRVGLDYWILAWMDFPAGIIAE